VWQALIETQLQALDQFLKQSTWYGRENELVNLFAHEFLPRAVSDSCPLKSLTQIGIEVAVRQVTGSCKRFVRKDLVLWPFPQMTAWPDGSPPAAIIEWKRGTTAGHPRDIKWLALYTGQYPQTVGVAVCVALDGKRQVNWTVIREGRPGRRW